MKENSEPVSAHEVASLAADLRTWLEVHQSNGALHPTAPLPKLAPTPAAEPSVKAARHGSAPGRPSKQSPAPMDLAGVRAELGECHRCNLSKGRRKIVFGSGSATADIVFVGEGPGFHEDQQGEPFVGAAGDLLNRIIENVLRLNRADVYIANVVKCRPPGNRNPEPAEVTACSPFLRKQLGVIEPKIIVALGRFAMQTLLNTDEPVGRLRGKSHPFHGAALIPTYHPAYLLRNPADKRKTMQDMMLVRSEYERLTGVTLPPVARPSR